jgi:large subunit ribosomal protein L28
MIKEVSSVARLCEVCGKGVQSGFAVSHANNRTKRNWSPNIQRVRALVNGRPVRLSVCTRCLRSGKVQRAV